MSMPEGTKMAYLETEKGSKWHDPAMIAIGVGLAVVGSILVKFIYGLVAGRK